MFRPVLRPRLVPVVYRFGVLTAASDMNGAARAEKRGTDIGGAATGVPDQDGVVWDDIVSVQRWARVDIG